MSTVTLFNFLHQSLETEEANLEFAKQRLSRLKTELKKLSEDIEAYTKDISELKFQRDLNPNKLAPITLEVLDEKIKAMEQSLSNLKQTQEGLEQERDKFEQKQLRSLKRIASLHNDLTKFEELE